MSASASRVAPPPARIMVTVQDDRARGILEAAVTRSGSALWANGAPQPDVLVTDWPPPLRSQALITRLGRRIEVVAVIADGDARSADAALDSGAGDCIMQPVRTTEAGVRVAAAARRLRDRMRLANPEDLIDALPSGLAVLAPDGSIAQANRAMAEMVGCSAEGLMGVRVGHDPLLGPDPQRVVALFRRARAGGSADGALTLRTVSGDTQPVAVRIAAVRDDTGTVSAYMLTARPPSESERTHSALHRIAVAATSGPPSGVFGRMAAEASALVGAASVAVLRAATDGQVVMGSTGSAMPTGTRLDTDARLAASVAVPNLADHSVVRVPLTVAGRVWGELVASVPTPAEARAQSALQRFAGLASLATADADARGTGDNARDHLTGLPGHRAFFDRLGPSMVAARAARRPVSVVVIDIDRLKRVNDAHGHVVGDEVVREVAARMTRVMRDGDLLARTGGEEFAWLMDGTDLVSAMDAARRMRRAICEPPLPGVGTLTASFGVAQLGAGEPGGDLPTDALRQAEVALQWAKMSGGNRCVAYSFEVAEQVFARRADLPAEAPSLRAMRALAWAVDARDPNTQRHSSRVADLAVRIATVLGWATERLTQLREAGLVHDVGKINVPDAILFKTDALTDEEYELVKRHSVVGAQIVADVLSAEQASWVRSHHERVDGGGYPDGLFGDQIPEEARVLAVADSWDVMVSPRSYKAPLDIADALDEMRRCAGSQFWPPAVDALQRLVEAGVLDADTVDSAAWDSLLTTG